MHAYIHRNAHLIIFHITSTTNTRVAGLSHINLIIFRRINHTYMLIYIYMHIHTHTHK